MYKDIEKKLWAFECTDRDILKKKMKEVGINTLKDLAKVLNVSYYYINNVVNRYKRIDKTFFEKLKSIGIDLSELIKEKTRSQKALEKIQDISRWLYSRFTYGTKCIFIDGFKVIEEDLNKLEKLEKENIKLKKVIEIFKSFKIILKDDGNELYTLKFALDIYGLTPEEYELIKEVLESE